jgi:hypothetical protein
MTKIDKTKNKDGEVNSPTWERHFPEWRFAGRQSGDWRPRVVAPPPLQRAKTHV